MDSSSHSEKTPARQLSPAAMLWEGKSKALPTVRMGGGGSGTPLPGASREKSPSMGFASPGALTLKPLAKRADSGRKGNTNSSFSRSELLNNVDTLAIGSPRTTNTSMSHSELLGALANAADAFTSVSCEVSELRERQQRKEQRLLQAAIGVGRGTTQTRHGSLHNARLPPLVSRSRLHGDGSSPLLPATATKKTIRPPMLTEQMDHVSLINHRVAHTMDRIARLLSEEHDEAFVTPSRAVTVRQQQNPPQANSSYPKSDETREQEHLQRHLAKKLADIARYQKIISERRKEEMAQLDEDGKTDTDVPDWLKMHRAAANDTRTAQTVVGEWQAKVSAANQRAKRDVPLGEARPKLHVEVERERQRRVAQREALLHKGRIEAKSRMYHSGLESVFDVPSVTGNPLNLPRRINNKGPTTSANEGSTSDPSPPKTGTDVSGKLNARAALSYMLNNFTKDELQELEEASLNKPGAVEAMRRAFRETADEAARQQEAQEESSIWGVTTTARNVPPVQAKDVKEGSPLLSASDVTDDMAASAVSIIGETEAFSSLSDSSISDAEALPKRVTPEVEAARREKAERRTESKRIRKAARAKPFPQGVALGAFLESETNREARRDRERTLIKKARKQTSRRRSSSQGGGSTGKPSSDKRNSKQTAEPSPTPLATQPAGQHGNLSSASNGAVPPRRFWRFLRGKVVEVYHQPKVSSLTKCVLVPPAHLDAGGPSESDALNALLRKGSTSTITKSELESHGLLLEYERRLVPGASASSSQGAVKAPNSLWIRIDEEGSWVPAELAVPTGDARRPFALVRSLASVTLIPLYNLSSSAILQTVADEVGERVAQALRVCPVDLLETPPSDEVSGSEGGNDDKDVATLSPRMRSEGGALTAERRRRREAFKQSRLRALSEEQRHRDLIRMLPGGMHERIAALQPSGVQGSGVRRRSSTTQISVSRHRRSGSVSIEVGHNQSSSTSDEDWIGAENRGTHTHVK